METCGLGMSVKLTDCIKNPDFIERNLNPYVLLTDIRKPLTGGGIRNFPKSPKRNESGEVGSQSIQRKIAPGKGSKELKQIMKEITFEVTDGPRKLRENGSTKRKRESWDPSVEYEVEKIVGYHRDKRKKMWYLVKWKHWSDDYNTFEPIGNLTRCNFELMKFFETKKPTDQQILEKDLKIEESLKNLEKYKILVSNECRTEDLEDFARELPTVSELFETKNLKDLEERILHEYECIVRCLIGMYSHQDPGMFARGQNYKILLKLISLRRKQLQKLSSAERYINSREETKIEIENKVDLEEFPRIDYIVEMKVGEGVTLPKEALVGCECPGGCSKKSRCCGKMADSIFAYQNNGRLRTSERVAIYECNSRCWCPPTCPNRIVQRGRQVKLCIFKTKSCGWGVKAMEKIPRGTFVCEYIGEIIPDSEAVVRDLVYKQEKKTGYLFDLDFFTDSDLDMYCIDATKHGNVARFINHSCNPNLVVYAVWVEGLEPNLHRLAFFARRNIYKGEEIHFDYENLSEDAVEEGKAASHGVRMMSDVRCQCNSFKCRKWVFGNK